jgi:uncharacterized FlaG/YvyC family protein
VIKLKNIEQKAINDDLKYLIHEKYNHQIEVINSKNKEIIREIGRGISNNLNFRANKPF